MTTTEDSWKNQSSSDLMDEAVRLELVHANLTSHEQEAVRARFDDLVLTCSYVKRPGFSEFSKLFGRMCTSSQMHPLTIEPFLRAAWKACDEEAKGLRPIAGKAELEDRARELRRALILDTEESWAYEGLPVRFRAELEEGGGPTSLAVADGEPSSLGKAQLEEGMRAHIENGGLEAFFARAAASFEARQESINQKGE